MMIWDDARRAELRKLRRQGLTATEIAERIGHGLTRNAVCGAMDRYRDYIATDAVPAPKKHAHGEWGEAESAELRRLWRLGYADTRITAEMGWSSATISERRRKLGLESHYRRDGATISRPAGAPKGEANALAILARRSRQVAVKGIVAPVQYPEPEVPKEARRVPLLGLEPRDCRWPIGDPAKPDFAFCGINNNGKGPYCAYHHVLAYIPIKERKSNGMALRGWKVAA